MRALRTTMSCLFFAGLLAGCVIRDSGPRGGYYGDGYYAGGYNNSDWDHRHHSGW
jgi:hypothetical protein